MVFKKGADGERLEPIEEVVIDVDEEHSGVVVQKMSERKAELVEMRPSGGGRLRLVFHAPTRGLIGYQGELLTDTRGTAIMNRLFHAYAPYKGEIQGRRNGVLISNDQGEAVAYALWNLEDRGPMMIEPGWKVYPGHDRRRAHARQRSRSQRDEGQAAHQYPHDEQGRGGAPHAADQMTLEKALAYIQDDELVEVTPKSTSACASAISTPTSASAFSKSKAASAWSEAEAGPAPAPLTAASPFCIGRSRMRLPVA